MEIFISDEMKKRASKYVYLTGNDDVDKMTIIALELVRQNVLKNYGNDKSKYHLPEAYKTDLIYTINARSLRNLFDLRSSKRALPEMRELTKEVWGVLPEQVRFIFQDVYHIQVWE